MIHTQIAEDAREALAQRHGDHAVFLELLLTGGLLRGLLLLCAFELSGLLGLLSLAQALTALLGHVVNLQVDQLAQLTGVIQRLARLVGVHVHLDQREVTHDDHTVANARQPRAEAVHVILGDAGVHLLNDELRAILEFDLLEGVMIVLKLKGRGSADIGGGLLDLLAVEGGAPAAQHSQQTLSAGIHHTGLLECGQHVRRFGQDRLAAADDLVKQPGEIVRMLDDIARRILRNHADDRQDCALLGLHDSLVRRVRAGAQSLRKERRVDGLAAVNATGEAAQNLRENHARVAARTLERAARSHIGQL